MTFKKNVNKLAKKINNQKYFNKNYWKKIYKIIKQLKNLNYTNFDKNVIVM